MSSITTGRNLTSTRLKGRLVCVSAKTGRGRGRLASRSPGSRHSNDVISTWPLSFLSWLSCVILDALLEMRWRRSYGQLQAYHPSLLFLPCLYIDFHEEPKSCKAPDYDIGAIASYPNFAPALLYPYKQNASWNHPFLLELRESLWKVVLLFFTGICETASHVPGTGAQWWLKPWNEWSHPSQRL